MKLPLAATLLAIVTFATPAAAAPAQPPVDVVVYGGTSVMLSTT